MSKIRPGQLPVVAGQAPAAPVAKPAAPAKAAPAAAEEKESSYEPKRKRLVSTTGRYKAGAAPGVPARPDLSAEISARRYGPGGGKAPPPKAAALTVDRSAAQITVKGSAGNDVIKVEPRRDGKPGVDVVSGKERISLTEAEAKKLTVDAGAGNDKVLVDPRVTYDLTLLGGSGDDLVRGGGGANRVQGGAGRDVLYGGEGKDTLVGGTEADVIQGGGGDDRINGGDGDDVLYGGGGDDTIGGGAGKNVIAGGEGANRYAQGAGRDTVYAQKGDQFGKEKDVARPGTTKKVELAAGGAKPAGHTIKIEGSPAFKAKVEADLDALRSTPTGRALLADIDKHPDKPVVIKEGANQSKPDDENAAMEKGLKLENKKTGKTYLGTGEGSGSTVTFDPDLHRSGIEQDTAPAEEDDPFTMPPAVALFHELVHSHRSQVGESSGLQMLEEYQTTGSEKSDRPRERHDWKYTENALRKELGLPDRAHYEG